MDILRHDYKVQIGIFKKMKKEYEDIISKFFPFPVDDEGLEKILNIVIVKEAPAGTILLSEGDIATKLFLVIKGCLNKLALLLLLFSVVHIISRLGWMINTYQKMNKINSV